MLTQHELDRLEELADAWENAEALAQALRDGTLPPAAPVLAAYRENLSTLSAAGVHSERRA